MPVCRDFGALLALNSGYCISLLLFAAIISIVRFAQVLCSVIAGVLHYLFLASFAWMCLEGIQLYVMLVEVFEVEKSRIKWYYLAAYGMLSLW